MAIPGYDLDDLDENLRERLEDEDIRDYLTEEEYERLNEGESLTDLLDEDDLDRLLEGKSRQK